MKENFTIVDKETGKTYWISRAMAVTTVLLKETEKDGIMVLLQRRGPGCPDNIGKLCCSCGYLNWGETLKEAAIRELWEETGIKVRPEKVVPWKLIDDPNRDARENVVQRFVGWIDSDDTQEPNPDTVSRGGEEGEIEELVWMKLDEAKTMDTTEFAFNHKEMLVELGMEMHKFITIKH